LKLSKGKICLILFLGLNLCCLSEAFIFYFKLLPEITLFYMRFCSFLLLPPMLLFYSRDIQLGDRKYFFREILIIIFVLNAISTINGLFKNGYGPIYVFDLYSFWGLFIFLILGTSRRFWVDFESVGFHILILGFLVNIPSSFIIKPTYHIDVESLADITGSGRIAILILAYKTQWALAFSPYFFLISDKFGKGKKILIYIIFFFNIFQQIIFQKRAPIIRFITYLVLNFFAFKSFPNGRKRVLKWNTILYYTLIVFLSVSILTFIIPIDLLYSQVEGLLKRLQGETGHVGGTYSNPVLSIFSTENERIIEVLIYLESCNISDIFFGKGFGGYFYDNLIFKLDRAQIHIGIFNFMLKNGIFMMLIYFFSVLICILKYSTIKKKLEANARFWCVMVTSLFYFMEGFHYYNSASFDLILLFTSIGYIISCEDVS